MNSFLLAWRTLTSQAGQTINLSRPPPPLLSALQRMLLSLKPLSSTGPSVNVVGTYFSLFQPYLVLFSKLLGYLLLHNVGPQIMQFQGVEMAGGLHE